MADQSVLLEHVLDRAESLLRLTDRVCGSGAKDPSDIQGLLGICLDLPRVIRQTWEKVYRHAFEGRRDVRELADTRENLLAACAHLLRPTFLKTQRDAGLYDERGKQARLTLEFL